MKLADLPDINFIDVDSAAIQQAVFESYERITGRSTPAQGDPVRLFLLFIADVVIRLENKINYTGKMNLLKYAEGDFLDQLGALVETERIPASAATTTIEVTLSAVQESEVIVPAGTRISPAANLYFATDEALIITAGEMSGTVSATCTDTGAVGNGYLPGEVSQIVDPVPFVATMVNTTTTEGGAAEEDDDDYRERIHEAPERFSTAGPAGAYHFYTMSANSAIADAAVWSPEPGVVEVRPLLEGGELPGEELIADVLEALNDDKIRPLTDQVRVVAPDVVSYDIEASYYVDADADAVKVEGAVDSAVNDFILWQKAKLGRDINPSRLISKMMAVSGVKRVEITAPVFTEVGITQVAVAENVSVVMAGSEDE